jgi:8-oxo-dGTP pyrophosphatase MutT (NUDIX family)
MSDRIHVVSAVIIRDGRVLLQQRRSGLSYARQWETPGGKVEPRDPTPIDALMRELGEELAIFTYALNNTPILVEDLDPPNVNRALRFEVYRMAISGGSGPDLLEAMGIGWFLPEEARSLMVTPGTAAAMPHILSILSAQSPAAS